MEAQSQQSITELAQARIKKVVREGDTVIDATIGNGNDTFFLADRVGPEGLVYGFDIQELALHRANVILGEGQLLGRVRLMQYSHALMADMLPEGIEGKIRAVMFNLGYLPRGNKSIVTKPESTVAALNAALSLLAPGGRITVVAYTGHKGGDEEAMAVRLWLKDIPQDAFETELILPHKESEGAPELYIITRNLPA